MPKVSVLTPIYRTNVSHLRECIESVLNQTFTDFEFLILNDSPDETYLDEIVASYNDNRIKYFKNDKNMGISPSRNKLLDLAQGEYLAIFDHDDISLPERLEKQVAYLDANPDVGVCGCWTVWFPENEKQSYAEDNLKIKNDLLRHCAVPHSGATIRKSVMIDNDIRWESEFSPAEDYMLWIRLLGKTMFHNLQEVLLYYRNDTGNTSHRQHEKMLDRDALIKCIAYQEYPYLIPKIKEQYRQWLKMFYFIPIARITSGRNQKMKVYLFGFIPLFSINQIHRNR